MSEAEELVEALRAEFKRYAFLRPVRRRVRLLLLPFQDGASAERKRKKRIIIHEAEAVEADIGGFRVGSVAQEEAGVVEKAQQPPSADVALPISALFSVGDIVEVARRMWPGINKPGGTARVTGLAEDDDGAPLYHVRYTVVGGSERGVEERYLKPSEHSSLQPQSRKNNLLGRCRVEHCPCFIKDCGHIQPGEPGYVDPTLLAALGAPPRRGSGGAMISQLKCKIEKIKKTIASNLREMAEEGKEVGRAAVFVAKAARRKKSAEPTKGAGREVVRERVDIFIGSKCAARTLCSLADVPEVAAAEPSVAALYRQMVERYDAVQPEAVFIQPEGLSQAELLPADASSNDFIATLSALSTDSLLDLVSMLNMQLAAAISELTAVVKRAAALRNAMSRSVYSPRGLSGGSDIVAAAMSVLTVTDDFDDLDIRTTRLVLDVFNQLHRLFRRERKAGLMRAQRQRWALVERRNSNLAEEWRDVRSGCLDCIKALHRRFESDFGMCAEDALDEDSENGSDDGSDYDEDWLLRAGGATATPRRRRVIKSAEEQAMDGPARGSSLLFDRERFRRRRSRGGGTVSTGVGHDNSDDTTADVDDNSGSGRQSYDSDVADRKKGLERSFGKKPGGKRVAGSEARGPRSVVTRAGRCVAEGCMEGALGVDRNSPSRPPKPPPPVLGAALPAADGSTVLRFLKAVCGGAALLPAELPVLPDSGGSSDLLASIWSEVGAALPLVREIISAAVADYKRSGLATTALRCAFFGSQGLLRCSLPQITPHRQEILGCFLDRGAKFEDVYIFGGGMLVGSDGCKGGITALFDIMKRESFAQGSVTSCIAAMDYLVHKCLCLRHLAVNPLLVDCCKKQLERSLEEAAGAALAHSEILPAVMELLLNDRGSSALTVSPYLRLLHLWRIALGLMIELDGQYAKRSWKVIESCIARRRLAPDGSLMVSLATEKRSRAGASGVMNLLIVHTFLLRHASPTLAGVVAVPHCWSVLQRFCLSALLPAENLVAWHWESRLKDFFDKVAVLSRLWDLPSEGLCIFIDLGVAHSRQLQLDHRSCRHHGCASHSRDTQPSPSADTCLEQQALLALQDPMAMSCEAALDGVVQQLFRSCQLGSLDSSTCKCECGFSWGALLAIKSGLKQFLLESCKTEPLDSMTRRRLKIALTRQEGLMRLVAPTTVLNSFFQWSLLGMLVREAYSWSGDASLFDEIKNSDSVSALGNNRLVRALLGEEHLSAVQQACVMWQLVAAGGAPVANRQSCALLELLRAEICRCAGEVGLAAEETQPLIVPANPLVPMQPFSPLARRLITASMCAANALLFFLQRSGGYSQDLMLSTLRCHAGLGLLASQRSLGVPRGTSAVAACMSLSYSFKCAQRLVETSSKIHFNTSAIAMQVENPNPNANTSVVPETVAVLSRVLLALLQQAVPQVRSTVQALQALGLEYAPSFCLNGPTADPLAHCLLVCTEGLSQLFAALFLLELSCRSGAVPRHDRKQLAPQHVMRVAVDLFDSGLKPSDSPLRTLLYCAFYSPIVAYAASGSVGSAYCLELLLEQPWLLDKLCLDVLVTVAASSFAQPSVGVDVGLLSLQHALRSLASCVTKLSFPAAAVCSALNAADREQSPRELLACIFGAVSAARVSLSGEPLKRLRQGLRLGAGDGAGHRALGAVCLSEVVVRVARYLALCAFRVSERSRFDILLSTQFLQSLLMSTIICIAGISRGIGNSTAPTSLFERQDLSDAAYGTVIGEFVGNNAKVVSRTIVVQGRGSVLKSSRSCVSVQALQESSLFISYLPFYVKCIPSIAFSTRQLQWECLLELFITAWGCHCSPLDGSADDAVSMELKVVVAWSLALTAPSVIQGSSYAELVRSCSAAVADALRPVIKALEIADRFASAAGASAEQDDRIRQLRLYLLLSDKAWVRCSASLLRDGGSSLTNELRPLAGPSGALSSRVALTVFTAMFARKLGPPAGAYAPSAGECCNLIACCALLAVRALRICCREPFFLVDPTQIASSTAERAIRTYVQLLLMGIQAGVLAVGGQQVALLRTLLEGCCGLLLGGASSAVMGALESTASNLLHCLCLACNCPLYTVPTVQDATRGDETCGSQSCQLCSGGAVLRELRVQLREMRPRAGASEISSQLLKSAEDRVTVHAILAAICSY